jgi:uncharacterized protein (TIGR04255 family)
VGKHSPWKSPAIQEALLEIRFPVTDDYALFLGHMMASLTEQFPSVERTQPQELPPFVKIPGLVLHRFYNFDKSILFQIGPDIVSVNVITYSGFNVFVQSIKDVLFFAEKYVKLRNLNQLSLRYINKFEEPTGMLSTLNIQVPFDDVSKSKTLELQIRHVKREGDDVSLSVNVQLPIEQTGVILDLNAFYISEGKEWDIEGILDWTDRAHEVIWSNFDALVSEKEKEKRK